MIKLLGRTMSAGLVSFVVLAAVAGYSLLEALRSAKSEGRGTGGPFGSTLAEATCAADTCSAAMGNRWWFAVIASMAIGAGVTAGAVWLLGHRRRAVAHPATAG